MSTKTAKKAKKAAPKTKTPKNVDVDALRTALKDAGVKFGGRTGLPKLLELAAEHKIKVPTLQKTGSVVPNDYKKSYGPSQNCGDDIALALTDYVNSPKSEGSKTTTISPDALAEVANQNGVDLGRWSHLNIGLQRMNLGNVLRGMQKRGDNVQVGKTKFKGHKEGKGAAL